MIVWMDEIHFAPVEMKKHEYRDGLGPSVSPSLSFVADFSDFLDMDHVSGKSKARFPFFWPFHSIGSAVLVSKQKYQQELGFSFRRRRLVAFASL